MINRSSANNSLDSNIQQENAFHIKQAYQKVEMLELEKLKLLEQLEFISSKLELARQDYTETVLQKDLENTDLQHKLLELEKLNGELLIKIQNQKRSEIQLNNANYNFTLLQKKVDQLSEENEQLLMKLTNISSQNQQLREKWQKCSASLKGTTNTKVRIKELELELKKKSLELNQVKEKYISTTLELTILKEAEQEYKNNVSVKVNYFFFYEIR